MALTNKFAALLMSVVTACACGAETRETHPACAAGDRSTWLQPPFSACSLRHVDTLFPMREVAHGSTPAYTLREDGRLAQATYTYGGHELTFDDFMRRTHAQAAVLAVGHDVLAERYIDEAARHDRFLTFSVTKSVVSILVGIAIDRHLISDVQDRVDHYLPELKGSAYEGATIRDLLEMSSGTSFDESYESPESSIAKFIGLVEASRGGVYEFSRSFKSARAPGNVFRYASADTEVLGALVSHVAGSPIASFASAQLWSKLGTEDDAQWLLDSPGGREVCAGGIAARVRDLARLGLLVAHGGTLDGTRIVSREWIEASTTPASPATEFGTLMAGSDLGYGYQWWVRQSPGEVLAIGIYGQFILIDKASGAVLAIASDWERPFDPSRYDETIALFSDLVRQLGVHH